VTTYPDALEQDSTQGEVNGFPFTEEGAEYVDPADTLDRWITLGHGVDPAGAVSPDGYADGPAASLINPDPELTRTLYRDVLLTRRLDTEATALQRQGELSMWIPCLGQEGAQAGAFRAVRPTDMLFPSYREHTATVVRDIDPGDLLAMFRGITHGGWDPQTYHCNTYTIVLAAQMLHAVGYAMGIQRDGTDEVVVACIGDGASSQGDANEAFVWAASQNAPVVFLIQNNQWAISVPVERQSRQPLARRADGFGFPGLRVDGNDALAMHGAMSAAAAHARSGAGPVLIEAVTYRLGPHTTSDDPGRYRDRIEEDLWRGRDPLSRLRALLTHQGWADDDWFAESDALADAYGTRVREAVLSMPDPEPESAFAHVYVDEPPTLAAQRDNFLKYRSSFTN
jgi:pyruvate dehydrogenase E1 component alpha subunit